MANGFVPYILARLKDLAQQNYQGFKITPSGFVQSLLENAPPAARVSSVNGLEVGGAPGVKLNNTNGHIRTVQFKHLPRIISSQIQTADDCDNDLMFSYSESSINTPRYASLSFFVDWSRVEYYENEASRAVSLGNPAYGAISEIEEQLLHCANGLVTAIDDRLVQDVAWGANLGNTPAGTNTAQTVNIDSDATVFDLSNGITKVLADARLNEVAGSPILVGGGLLDNFMISKQAITGANPLNFNAIAPSGYKYYFDIASQTRWGANQFGVFAPGTIAFVDIDRYVAWKTGRFGTSHFCTIDLPVQSGSGMTTMTFNMQVIEQDCPGAEFPDGYSTITRDRGYQIILSKRYGLWQLPGTSVQATDRLTGVNGAFRYTLTNNT